MKDTKKLVAGIIGTGPIGLGCAGLLSKNGIETLVWSPTGSFDRQWREGQSVCVSGAVEHSFIPSLVGTAKELVQSCDIILIAVPAYGHRFVLDEIAQFMRTDQTLIISSHVPFSGNYIQAKLDARGVAPLIVALSTTIVAGRKSSPVQVNLSTLRDRLDMATLPGGRAGEGMAICQQLFGDRFVLRDGLAAISLSNLNPQNHLGIALCNLTRIERGETWIQAENVTPSVGRLLEKLDVERLAIGQALGLKLRNIFEHFSWSFHVDMDSVAQMSAQMVQNGQRGCGPTSMETRYILEDVPFGLVPVAWLGRQIGMPAVLHEAGITIFNAIGDCDYYDKNDLMGGLRAMGKSDADLLQLLGIKPSNSDWQGRTANAMGLRSNFNH